MNKYDFITELSAEETATITGGVAMAGTGFDTNYVVTGTGLDTNYVVTGTGLDTNYVVTGTGIAR